MQQPNCAERMLGAGRQYSASMLLRGLKVGVFEIVRLDATVQSQLGSAEDIVHPNVEGFPVLWN